MLVVNPRVQLDIFPKYEQSLSRDILLEVTVTYLTTIGYLYQMGKKLYQYVPEILH